MESFNVKQVFMDNYNYIKSEFIVFVTALVAPTVPMLFLIGFLIMMDTFSGIYGAIKKGGWRAFKSKLLSTGVMPKLIFYPLAILLAQAMESQFPMIPCMKTVGFVIMTIEVKSISENYKIIFGISIFDSLRNLISKKMDTDNAKKENE